MIFKTLLRDDIIINIDNNTDYIIVKNLQDKQKNFSYYYYNYRKGNNDSDVLFENMANCLEEMKTYIYILLQCEKIKCNDFIYNMMMYMSMTIQGVISELNQKYIWVDKFGCYVNYEKMTVIDI